MASDSNMHPDEDILQALESASAEPDTLMSSPSPKTEPIFDAITGETSRCPVFMLRYTLMKCGLMAEKYPWQTTVLLLSAVGCGWLCTYFGWSVLAALILYAASTED